MYGSLLPNIISNVFSEFNIKVTFKTNNNISNLLCIKRPFPLEEKTGVYLSLIHIFTLFNGHSIFKFFVVLHCFH